MANAKFSSHARSTSWPSSSSHPLVANAEKHLQRLKSSSEAASSSHESTCRNLDGLKILYSSLDDVLHLPNTQQILTEESVLEESLSILDICGEVREIYSQKKEIIQQLEASLRRKRTGDFTNEIATYINSKKTLNKRISKCYKELKKAVMANGPSSLIHEIQQVSFTILESSLSFISGSNSGSNAKGWALVSKLIHPKGSSSSKESKSEIEKIEVELYLLKGKNSDSLRVGKQLEAFYSSIQESEELLESVFRQLLKTRVTFLNILNH